MDQIQAGPRGAVFLVDDDKAVRRGVGALLAAADYAVNSFESAEDFLASLPALALGNAVMLVDVCMPGIQGLELQERLKNQGVQLPVIVMTAHGDIAMAVRAMRNGAVDFLEKPFTVEEVTAALDRALSIARPIPKLANSAPAEMRAHYEALTPRENEVLCEIVNGATNKEIARTLEISPRTVEVHRQNIMQKMHAHSFAELVRMAVALDICG
jgi:two-component system response regulator FixJ